MYCITREKSIYVLATRLGKNLVSVLSAGYANSLLCVNVASFSFFSLPIRKIILVQLNFLGA